MDPRTWDLVYGRVVGAEDPEWRAKPMIPEHTQDSDVGDDRLVPSVFWQHVGDEYEPRSR